MVTKTYFSLWSDTERWADFCFESVISTMFSAFGLLSCIVNMQIFASRCHCRQSFTKNVSETYQWLSFTLHHPCAPETWFSWKTWIFYSHTSWDWYFTQFLIFCSIFWRALNTTLTELTPEIQLYLSVYEREMRLCRYRFSAFWLRSKCSICSYQLNIWYVPHRGTTILNWFLDMDRALGACSASVTGLPGIAVPPGSAHL